MSPNQHSLTPNDQNDRNTSTIAAIIKKWGRPVAAWSSVFILCYVVGLFIPEGFDWIHFFSMGQVSPIWTPWTKIILPFLNWPLLVALTLFAVILRSYRYSKSPIPMALAIISLPTLWVIFLGNLDGLVLIGLMLLPWGAPLALMKPQLSAFALLAKKSYIIAGIVWGLLSLLIWGLWPLKFFAVLSPEWKVAWFQDIALFPWGLIIALPLLWFSRGDEDLLMAAGSFATPHLFIYHFILLMPALGRMKKFWMLLTWAVCWTPLLANWLGPLAWHFGNLLSVCFWVGIYTNRKLNTPQSFVSPPITPEA
jgi:hypothetical protein